MSTDKTQPITMMNLKEPKKKKRVRLQPQPLLPIDTNENGEWRIYTAHLSASGTCIVDPIEMEAIYSMGFFGKGSLSRSFPSFGRRRFGVPPMARNRQWVRRQKWLEELQILNDNNSLEALEDLERMVGSKSDEDSQREVTGAELYNGKARASTSTASTELEKSVLNETEKDPEKEFEIIPKESSNKRPKVDDPVIPEKAPEVKEIEEKEIQKPDDKQKEVSPAEESMSINENQEITSTVIYDESMKVDEVVLDSTEDEETCEIVEEGSNDEKDVCFLNEEGMAVKSDDYFKYRDINETFMEEETDPYEVLVLPDTDSDTENYLTNVKSKIEKGGFPINETLHLTFEETFFLMYGLGCLQLIHYDGSVFSISNAWNHFQLQDQYFIQKYVVYHYFRSKGWIVKPGLKFGGDYLLYKEGPPFYHASYIVIIEVMDADTLLRDDVKSMRKITWKNLIGLERLSETISKEILFAQILWPSSILRNGNQMPVDGLSEFTVRELLWRRWNPKRKQDFASMDEEDSDST